MIKLGSYIVVSALILVGCQPQQKVVISNAFMPTSGSLSEGLIYLSLENKHKTKLELIYVQSEIADNIEIFRTYYEDGVKNKKILSHIAISAGEKVHFRPGGYGLAVSGLVKKLESGDTFDVQFEFDNQVRKVTRVTVR